LSHNDVKIKKMSTNHKYQYGVFIP